jgi:uncharacterized protein YndB with AHSA1/START domain
MTTSTRNTVTTQVYRVYIKAKPEKIWEAITKPEWTQRYGYGGLTDYDMRAGAKFETHPTEAMKAGAAAQGFEIPDVIVDGEIVESDPPRRLVMTWRMLMDPGLAAEGFTRLTYEIEDVNGASKLTIVHELENAPNLAALVDGAHECDGGGGGWAWVLSDLKSLLETGKILAE